MSRTPPERFKPRDDWSVDEILDHQRTGSQPETDEFRAYVRKTHEDAGLDPPEEPASSRPVDELDADDHFDQIRRTR